LGSLPISATFSNRDSFLKKFITFARGKIGGTPPGAIECINGGMANIGEYVLLENIPSKIERTITRSGIHTHLRLKKVCTGFLLMKCSRKIMKAIAPEAQAIISEIMNVYMFLF
jgi:hypothetical protein